jgi:hypothetical protein
MDARKEQYIMGWSDLNGIRRRPLMATIREASNAGFRRFCKSCGALTPSTMHAPKVICAACKKRNTANRAN